MQVLQSDIIIMDNSFQPTAGHKPLPFYVILIKNKKCSLKEISIQ